MTHPDYLAELKELAFASRLRRLADRLARDVSRIYADIDIPFEARWFSLFSLLDRHGEMSVTDAAARLNVSHAAVNQVAGQLTRKGLVVSRKAAGDDRVRMLSLSDKGRDRARALEPVWKVIQTETALLIDSVDDKLVESLNTIEKMLDEHGMYDRVAQGLKLKPKGEIDIVPYRPAYKKHFKSINEPWLREFFGVDTEDMRQLDDPNGRIIRKGGEILFARWNRKIVGTCALINHPGEIWELAKMGVSPDARGLGIGRRLADDIIALAKEKGANKLYLLTAEPLRAAMNLYRKLGFKETKSTPLPGCKYERCTVAMELTL